MDGYYGKTSEARSCSSSARRLALSIVHFIPQVNPGVTSLSLEFTSPFTVLIDNPINLKLTVNRRKKDIVQKPRGGIKKSIKNANMQYHEPDKPDNGEMDDEEMEDEMEREEVDEWMGDGDGDGVSDGREADCMTKPNQNSEEECGMRNEAKRNLMEGMFEI
ncbi:hypothetical protein SISNIDRAFT_497187 [Sistotremastrum niveocremeum HHB9708]|uniref:Uncharacterized protein n=1 Tax=Sistotremastrum niveocremeum HHB9708 TaxID=1314777 RepID=A0A164QZG8_9AGAM|nr:hypothetical protein SISNIDRAFT_497187 [Sistotremastrum niveocremeum HHB9708]